MRDAIRRKQYRLRTEQSYLLWIKRYILFHGKRHPAKLGETHVTAFLNQLATVGQVSAATLKKTFCKFLFS